MERKMDDRIIEAVLEFLAAMICIGIVIWLRRTRKNILEKLHLSEKREEELSYLAPLEQAGQRRKRYWEQKITISFLLAGGGFLFAGFLTVKGITEQRESISALSRNETGKGTQRYTLYIEGETEPETYCLEVAIEEKKPTREEAEEQFFLIYEELRRVIAGENPSLEEVYESLFLPERLDDLGCTIQWMSDTWEIVSADGEVRNKELSEPCVVYLTAEVSYGDYQDIFYFSVQVCPKREVEGIWIDEVGKQISLEDKKDLENPMVALPEIVGEQKVKYYHSLQESGYSVGLLGAAAAGGLWIAVDYEIPKRKKKRQEELTREYSKVVSKLTLLIGAGMSIRLAWERIVEDNMQKQNLGAAEQEMQVTYYELKQGVAEGMAYRNFGKRIGLKPYRKLGNLLEQNLRKGTAGLTRLLEAEAAESFEIRKGRALMAGEEASSKLLIPMFFMLLIVLVICIVPALLTF